MKKQDLQDIAWGAIAALIIAAIAFVLWGCAPTQHIKLDNRQYPDTVRTRLLYYVEEPGQMRVVESEGFYVIRDGRVYFYVGDKEIDYKNLIGEIR